MIRQSILVINSGSSSVKFAVFERASTLVLMRRGSVAAEAAPETIRRILAEAVAELAASPVAAIGHRMVHGGPEHHAPTTVTADLLDSLDRLVPFAPNHLPQALSLVRECVRAYPRLPQVVCFDTAFHRTLPDRAARLPVSAGLDRQGVRRYGFHGLAFQSVMQQLTSVAPSLANGKVVLAHLGNGSSLAAVAGARSVDTTMGMTPIGGVIMSTRSGDLDPGVVTYLMRSLGLDADRLEHVLSHESGLLAISGKTSDMRELLAREATDSDCRLAVEMYCYEIKKRVGAYTAALGGLDGLVFSGGVGEHAPSIRRRICEGLAFLGIELEESRNAAGAPVISADKSRVTVRIVSVDEELVIAESVVASGFSPI